MLTLLWCSFHPMLPQWHVKDPGHSTKHADDRLHLNMHTPLIQQSRSRLTTLSRHSVGICQENDLTGNSSENMRPLSSQLAEPLWTDPGLKNRNWCARADLHLKKEKKVQAGNESSDFPKNSLMQGRSHHCDSKGVTH